MQNLVKKTSSLGGTLKATNYITTFPTTPIPLLAVPEAHKIAIDDPKCYSSTKRMVSALPVGNGILRAISGITVQTQYRYAHTDVKLPDNKQRRVSTMDPTKPARESSYKRKAFTYLATNGSLVFGVYMAKTVAVKELLFWWLNQDVTLAGQVVVDLSKIPEGTSITYKWQGKPLFIKHRTEEEIEIVRKMDHTQLRDPQRDEDRTKDPKWLICLGICTHLGCVPIANKGENFGGYFCPCHGSHYDASGRITNGPAPENLEIPIYTFTDDKTILVG